MRMKIASSTSTGNLETTLHKFYMVAKQLKKPGDALILQKLTHVRAGGVSNCPVPETHVRDRRWGGLGPAAGAAGFDTATRVGVLGHCKLAKDVRVVDGRVCPRTFIQTSPRERPQ